MAGTVSVRRIKGARQIYSASFLVDDLPYHCSSLSDDEFTRYQCTTLRRFNPSFNASILSVTEYIGGAGGVFVDAKVLGSYNCRSDLMKLYREIKAQDLMAGAVWQNSGTAVFNSFYMPQDMWKQYDIHRRMNAPLGINEVILLNYEYPFRQNTRIRFSYRTEAETRFGESLTKDEVEYYSLPFYFAWLFRTGAIDKSTLQDWLGRIVGITPLRLVLLRELNSFRQYRNSATAAKLGISPRVVNNQFHEIYNAVADVLPASTHDDGYQSKLVDLANTFSFLRFSGEYVPDATIRSVAEAHAAPIVASLKGEAAPKPAFTSL